MAEVFQSDIALRICSALGTRKPSRAEKDSKLGIEKEVLLIYL